VGRGARGNRVSCGSYLDCARMSDRAHSSHEYTHVSENTIELGLTWLTGVPYVGHRVRQLGRCAPRDPGVSTAVTCGMQQKGAGDASPHGRSPCDGLGIPGGSGCSNFDGTNQRNKCIQGVSSGG